MTNTNDYARENAALGLGLLREPSSVPNLLAALNDPDVNARINVLWVLQLFPAQAKIIAPALIKNLGDPDPDVRVTTVIALGSFGERAKPAVPQILKIIEENKSSSGGSAEGLYKALSEIDPEAAAKLDGK